MLFPLNFDISQIIGEKEIENVKPCDTLTIRMSGLRMVCKIHFFDYFPLIQSNPKSALKKLIARQVRFCKMGWNHGKRCKRYLVNSNVRKLHFATSGK